MTTTAVVFAFAVPDGLVPVPGTAPYDVIARQLPRQLVQLLNGSGDRGIRFFPFLATTAGRRCFLRVRELLLPAALRALPPARDGALCVDGLLLEGALQARIHGPGAAGCLWQETLPFDPHRPFDVLPRLQFEVATALGWTGPPTPLPALDGMALAWLLVAKDQLLALEAGIQDACGGDPLRAARELVAAAPGNGVVVDVVIETIAHCTRAGECRQDAALLLGQLAAAAPRSASSSYRIGTMLQALGDEAGAAEHLGHAAAMPEATAAMVEAAVAVLFRRGALAAARDLLLGARGRGGLGATGLGQLVAIADQLGEAGLREQIVDELAPLPFLPAAVARLVISCLLARGAAAAARDVAARATAQHPADAALWLELGRAALQLDDFATAAAALDRAAAQGLVGAAARDLARLRRFLAVPGLFAAMQRVDELLAWREPRQALRAAREVIRRSDCGESWLLLGIVHHRLGRQRRAEAALRRALVRDGALAEAHDRLGILLVGKGEIESGSAHLRRAAALSPGDPSPRLHLAQAMALQGRVEEGERLLCLAERLGADPGTVAAIRQRFFAA